MSDIERLRAAMELREEDHRRKTAEIERLRADLLTRDGQAQELQGEVARLRGLLREALKVRTWFAQQGLQSRIREALGE